MQCHQNLILPIVVPIVSYLFFKSVTYKSVTSDADPEKLEMKEWSIKPDLHINDPQYNPFIKAAKTYMTKNERHNKYLCDCSNCLKARSFNLNKSNSDSLLQLG